MNAIDFRLGYQINRHWQVNGLVGDESNSFTSTRSSNDGSRWDIGAVWTPNGRTVLDFGIGERFFGSTKRLNLSHTSRRSVLTANYSEELTNATTLLSDRVVFPVLDPFGQPILDPITGDPLLVEGDLVTINDSVFVDKRLAVKYSLRGRRTTLTVDGTISEQVYQDSPREVSNQGLGATLSRTLSGQLSGDIGLSWLEQNESGTGNRETETWMVQAGLSQQLGETTNLRFSYRFIDRSSNQIGQSYEENQLALT